MARIPYGFKSQTSLYTGMRMSSQLMGEHNDCTVVAIATVCGVSYRQAHAALKKHGRKDRCGTWEHTEVGAIRELGYDYEHIDPDHFISQYPGSHKNLKHVTTHHMDRFWKVWCDGQTYLVFTRRHVGAVVNGQNHDWTKGRAKRVRKIWRITKKESRS